MPRPKSYNSDGIRPVTVPASPFAVRFFARVLAERRLILVVFLLLGGLGIYGTTLIPNDNAIGSLSVADRQRQGHRRLRENVSRRRPRPADAGDA